MNDSNVEALQIKVAFLEDALNKLSDEYFQQQKELDTLKKQLVSMSNRIGSLQEDNSVDHQPQDERPPHY